jgi:Lysozyme like domain
MSHRHVNQHQRLVSSVERKLVGDLQEQNMSAISKELQQLSQMESRSVFKHDLARINHDLQTHGWLPHLKIVQNGDHFSVQPDSGAAEQADGRGGRRHDRRPQDETTADDSARPPFVPSGMRGRQNDQPAGDDRTFYGQPGAGPSTKRDMARIVADEARKNGVDPATAVAAMLAESGGDPNKLGDYKKVHGKRVPTSFGLLQLHKGGELGNLSPQQAFDPHINAQVSISHFREVQDRYGRLSPGWLAAMAQAPKDKAGYAAKVNRFLPEAHNLLASI